MSDLALIFEKERDMLTKVRDISLSLVSGAEKLKQEIVKYLLTPKNEHFLGYGSNLHELIGKKKRLVDVYEVVKREVIECLGTIKDLKIREGRPDDEIPERLLSLQVHKQELGIVVEMCLETRSGATLSFSFTIGGVV